MEESSCDDMELVARTCGGETEAFAVLVSRHQDYIYNAVFHLIGAAQDVEDIAQEVFLKAFHGLSGFRRGSRFSTWLYGIMLNCVRTYWRTRKRRPSVASLGGHGHDGNPVPDPTSPQPGPLTNSVQSERVELVRRAIGELERELREIIVLRDIEGLSYRELARVLRLPLGTVKSRLSRARSALRRKIAPALAVDL